jgi:hypothetical protein
MTTARHNGSGSAAGAARDRELRLAREAIAMVASGASPRVVIAGISFGEAIFDSACQLALQAGVRVKPLRKQDAGTDLVIEPIYE